MVRSDTHLLDVGRTVYLVDQDVPDGLVVVADRHPGAPVSRIAEQDSDRSWFIVSDLVQPVLPIALPRVPLDLPKDRQVLAVGRADEHFDHVPSLADQRHRWASPNVLACGR